jgi:hypothetical protein
MLSSFSTGFPDEPLSTANDDTEVGSRPTSQNAAEAKFAEIPYYEVR